MKNNLKDLLEMSKEDLVNSVFNRMVSDFSDLDGLMLGGGKSIPYIGWYWRSTDFVGKNITIGDCGEFVGVMENNKWDYPQRQMTEKEVDTFVEYIEKAYEEYNKGGCLDDLIKDRNKVLTDLWDWFQTLEIKDTDK